MKIFWGDRIGMSLFELSAHVVNLVMCSVMSIWPHVDHKHIIILKGCFLWIDVFLASISRLAAFTCDIGPYFWQLRLFFGVKGSVLIQLIILILLVIIVVDLEIIEFIFVFLMMFGIDLLFRVFSFDGFFFGGLLFILWDRFFLVDVALLLFCLICISSLASA